MTDDGKFTAMLRRTQESWENGQSYWSEAAGRVGGPETVDTCRDNAKFCLTEAADWAALREAFVGMREALAQYADERNWEFSQSVRKRLFIRMGQVAFIDEHGYELAQKALEPRRVSDEQS